MNAQINRDVPAVVAAVQALVAEFGLVRVAAALAGQALRPARRARRAETDLSDHVRRDIGLLPEPPRRNYWEL